MSLETFVQQNSDYGWEGDQVLRPAIKSTYVLSLQRFTKTYLQSYFCKGDCFFEMLPLLQAMFLCVDVHMYAAHVYKAHAAIPAPQKPTPQLAQPGAPAPHTAVLS